MYKKLSSTQDLTRGQRDYLKQVGFSDDKFNKLNPEQQHEWKKESDEQSYKNNTNKKLGLNTFCKIGYTRHINHELEAIWFYKKILIERILKHWNNKIFTKENDLWFNRPEELEQILRQLNPVYRKVDDIKKIFIKKLISACEHLIKKYERN